MGPGSHSPWVPRDGCVSVLEGTGKSSQKAGVIQDPHNSVLSGKRGANIAEREEQTGKLMGALPSKGMLLSERKHQRQGCREWVFFSMTVNGPASSLPYRSGSGDCQFRRKIVCSTV